MTCILGDEEIEGDIAPGMFWSLSGPAQAHRVCALREVIGGIGHLIAHEYWCTQRHDPDAGLTYHQSAVLVDCYVRAVGYAHSAEVSAPASLEGSQPAPPPSASAPC
jgi:hypothetical protein